jgi:hypothetical protein
MSGSFVAQARRYTIALRFVVLAAALPWATSAAAAQATPRFELGAGVAVLKHGGSANAGPDFLAVYNLTRYLSLEGSIAWFPSEAGFTYLDPFKLQLVETSAVQGLFGAKAGYRTNRFGVFGKVRPGFISSPSTERVTGFLPTPPGFGSQPVLQVGRLTEKALDLGGVVEYYPARHWALRADLGSTLIFDEGVTFLRPNPATGTSDASTVGAGTSSHFQFSFSGQFRF